MSALGLVALAAAGFVGSHFLLSHPLRALLVGRLGEKGFLGLYSLVAFATLGFLIWSARQVGPEAPLWDAGAGGWIVGSLLMWLGSILFAGSHKGNPAMPNPGRAPEHFAAPQGVFAITRHPMMWGFGLWALTHAIVAPTPSGLVLSAAIFVLAIGGSMAQDAKKARLVGPAWSEWKARTAFVPFARGAAMPSTAALVAGTLLFFAATWAHGALGYRPAGFWAFFG